MPEPVSRKDKFYAMALSIGYIMEHMPDGHQNKLATALRMIEQLYDDDLDLVSLHKFCAIGKEGGLDIEVKADLELEPISDKDLKDLMHEVSHDEALLSIAVGLGKSLQANFPRNLLLPHLRMLKRLVTKEDIEKCQDRMIEGLTKCGCDSCLERLKEIEAVKELNELLKEKKEKNGTSTEIPNDPFNGFAV